MFFYAHSGFRYLVLLAAIAVLLYSAVGMVRGRPYDRTMRILATVLAGSLHLQVLLGFAVLFSGRFYPALIGHILPLLLAAVVAQIVPSVMRRRPEAEQRYLPHLISGVVTLALIWVGIAAIGRGLLQTTGSIG